MSTNFFVKNAILFCSLILLSGCIAIQRSVEFVTVSPNSNLSLLKTEIRSFYNTGAYEAEVSRVADAAQRFVELRSLFFSKPAVVFDLDDTLLSSYLFFENRDFAFDAKAYQQYAKQGNMPAINPVANLLKQLVTLNIAVFIVTERNVALREATLQNLDAVELGGYNKIFFMPDKFNEGSVEAYKAGIREEIEQSGYTVIAAVSSQQSGLDGGFTLGTFKLPNYWHHIP